MGEGADRGSTFTPRTDAGEAVNPEPHRHGDSPPRLGGLSHSWRQHVQPSASGTRPSRYLTGGKQRSSASQWWRMCSSCSRRPTSIRAVRASAGPSVECQTPEPIAAPRLRSVSGRRQEPRSSRTAPIPRPSLASVWPLERLSPTILRPRASHRRAGDRRRCRETCRPRVPINRGVSRSTQGCMSVPQTPRWARCQKRGVTSS